MATLQQAAPLRRRTPPGRSWAMPLLPAGPAGGASWITGPEPVKTRAVPSDAIREVYAKTPPSPTAVDQLAETRTQDRIRVSVPGVGQTTVGAWEGIMVQGADPATARGTARQHLQEGHDTDVKPLLA